MTDLSTFSDRDLWVHFLSCDIALGDDSSIEDADRLVAQTDRAREEIERRFGEAATENTAVWFTATKADPTDMLRWAREETTRLIEVARGHDCDNASLDHNGRCWCGRQWARMANRDSWYDPTQGSDPSV